MKKRTHSEQAAAIALLDAVAMWPSWCSRRVDSIHPMQGGRGRQRHSIDCTPPALPGLAYLESERGLFRGLGRVKGPLMVPLAWLKKGPMRHFDASLDDGSSLPVLGMRETSKLSVAMLSEVLRRVGIKVTDDICEVLREIVGPQGPELRKEIEKLCTYGTWRGKQLWSIDETLHPGLVALIEDFAQNFILIGLLPVSRAGTRQILKFSFHWQVAANRHSSTWKQRVASRLNVFPIELDIEMIMPDGAGSYHLEFQTPEELVCERLEIPSPAGQPRPGRRSSFNLDTSRQPVAHVHGVFDRPPRSAAKVVLSLPRMRGLRTVAAASIFTAFSIFALAILLPGAARELASAPGGAAALLLAAPAAFLGYLATTNENQLTSLVHTPLRAMLVLSAWSLLAMAGSLIGNLEPFYRDLLWLSCLLGNLMFLILILFPGVVRGVLRVGAISLLKLERLKRSNG